MIHNILLIGLGIFIGLVIAALGVAYLIGYEMNEIDRM